MADGGGAEVAPPSVTTVALRHDADKSPWRRWGGSGVVPGIVVHGEEGQPPPAPTYSAPTPPSRLELRATAPTSSPRKSPVTVQEWVDSLPHPPPPGSPTTRRRQEEAELPVSEATDTSTTDTLVLGAEAGLLVQGHPPSIVVEGPGQAPVAAVSPPVSPRHRRMSPRSLPGNDGSSVLPADVPAGAGDRREQFNRARTTERMASFASDSAASNASSTGVENFLESRRLDPEKILLNLGFGGSQDSNGDLGLSRIPQRFLQPSQVKGISISQFYRHEMNLAETFETGFYGYRGLTGPGHTPSPIVAKIMARLRQRESGPYDDHSVASAPAGTSARSEAATPPPPSTPQQRFAAAVQKVQQSKSVLTRIQSWKSSNQQPTGSVLNPDNRQFLQSQALSKSPEVPRRRLIMGHRSYTFSGDGDLIECQQDRSKGGVSDEVPPLPDAAEPKRPRPPLVHKDSLLSSNTSFSEESEESEDEYRRPLTKRYSRRELSPVCPAVESSQETETPSPPKSPVKPSPLRHASLHKRLSSTSLSSWESENWSPSPPVAPQSSSRAAYNAFSSIEENCEAEILSQNRSVSVDSDVTRVPLVSPEDTFDPTVTSSPKSPDESQLTSGHCSAASDVNEICRSVSVTSSVNRRGSLKRQCKVSDADEDSWRGELAAQASVEAGKVEEGGHHHPPGPEMVGIAEEDPPAACAAVLSRAGSAQSDSSGFQEGEAGAAAGAQVGEGGGAVEEEASQVRPPEALRLEQLQEQVVRVASSLQAFRAETLAEANPEAQARLQLKVDQISGILGHLQSLCEGLQGAQTDS